MELMPALYVFAFNTRNRMHGLSNAVEDWFRKAGDPAVGGSECPALPRVIIAGKTVGLLDDGYMRLDPGDDVWPKWRKEHGENVRPLMSFWDTKRRFGWLACSLLNYMACRLGPEHASLGVNYDLTRYLSFESYSKNDLEGKEGYHSPWVPK